MGGGPLFPLCVNSHKGAGSIPAISAIWQMLRFLALSIAIATAAGYPLSALRRVGGIVATWKATIEKSHDARYCRAPCACHGDFFKTRETREIHSCSGHPPERAEPLVVSPWLLHPHHASRQELLPFLVHNRGIAIKFRCSLLDNPR